MPPGAFLNPFLRTPQPARVVAVIPARYESSRLPGKVLADIAGRPMIEHVYRRASDARGVDAVVVATDDARVAAVVAAFGGVVSMTGSGHRTGTDRVAEVARALESEIVVNVQGDLPLLEPTMVAEVIAPLLADAAVPMSTLRRAIAAADEYTNPNVVKVVIDHNDDALYFSRSPIPFLRGDGPPEGGPHEVDVGATFRWPIYKHIGMYGYRRDFLLKFAGLAHTPLEQAESLEQLRALEHGYRIRTVETQCESIEVDTLEDLERVRNRLSVAARA